MPHVPVMVDEVKRYLLEADAAVLLDGTAGAGGHAAALLEASESLHVIAVDRDPSAVDEATARLERFGDRARVVQGRFSELDRILGSEERIDGVLLDLGLSSMQLDRRDRGFSYSVDGPLDMRMSGDGPTAADYIATATATEIARTLKEYGEVPRAARIAREIKRRAHAGQVRTTFDLVAAVESALGLRPSRAKLSQVFQAMRVRVNGELDELERFLDVVVDHMNPRARIVIISYHSLEDRAVKRFFKRESAACTCPPEVPVCVCGAVPRLRQVTRRALRPTKEEIAANPRARSARLRAAEVMEEAVN